MRNMGPRWLLALSLFTASMFLLGLVFASYVRISDSSMQDQVAAQLKSEVHLHVERMQTFIGAPIVAIRILAQLPALVDAPMDSFPERTASIEKLFLGIAETRPEYAQIRFIAASGLERIRIENRNGTVHAAAADALQDKSDRYYFSETIRAFHGLRDSLGIHRG